MKDYVLEIKNLSVNFKKKSNIFSKGKNGIICAVDTVNLNIGRNEIHGLVGESGSGKSTLGRSIVGLSPVFAGEIIFHSKTGETTELSHTKKNNLGIQMVFQDPNSSLNPNMKIKTILSEPMIINHIADRNEISDRLNELMDMVCLSREYLDRYPHQLSGGQRQRVSIARAMATNPELIIADEPTSALDVSIQAQILNLLLDIREKNGISMLFISHNLSVVRHISDYVSVMCKGQIVESGKTIELFEHPEHAYTKKLWAAIPQFRQK